MEKFKKMYFSNYFFIVHQTEKIQSLLLPKNDILCFMKTLYGVIGRIRSGVEGQPEVLIKFSLRLAGVLEKCQFCVWNNN